MIPQEEMKRIRDLLATHDTSEVGESDIRALVDEIATLSKERDAFRVALEMGQKTQNYVQLKEIIRTVLEESDHGCPWIRCADRMPPTEADILIYISYDWITSARYLDKGHELFFDGSNTFSTAEVSHWRLMPDPPVEGAS